MKVSNYISCFILLCFATLSNAQVHYVTSGNSLYRINTTTCSSTLICNSLPVTINSNTNSGPLSDIAFGSNGSLYAMTSQHLVSVDTNSCTGTQVVSFNSSPTSLVGAVNGKMYAASDTLYEVDLAIPSITVLGALPCTSGGDLAFLNGNLYMTCQGGDLLQVDINNPSNSTNLGNLGANGNWFSLWIEYASCGNSQLYAANEDDIYNLTLSPINTTFQCSMGWSQWVWIDGATSQNDYLASGCNTTPSNIDASFNLSNTTICAGDSITFTDNSTGTITGWTWTFNGGSPASANTQGPHTIGFNTAGNHNITLQVTDGTNTDDTTIAITVIATDTAAFNYPSGSYCLVDPNPTPTITGTTGGTFTIDNSGVINAGTGEIDINASGIGNYIVTYITNGSCPDTATFNINIVTTTDATITPVSSFCENDPSLNLSAVSSGGTWTGTGITNATNGTFDPSSAGAGNHQIIYTISGGCGDADTINILVNSPPIISLTSTDDNCFSQEGSIISSVNGGISPYSYLWDNGGITSSLTNLASGTYSLTVIDSAGCSNTSIAIVNDQNNDCDYHIFLPNIFSPNGDGSNDIFKVRGKGIEAVSLIIYSRWGEKVFETNDPDIGWDGTFKGEPLNAAVFVYYLNATMINKEKIEQQGNVTLVK